jgi:hypothetical protein
LRKRRVASAAVARPAPAHSLKKVRAAELGKRWSAARSSASNAPAEQNTVNTSSPAAMIWEGVILKHPSPPLPLVGAASPEH